MNASRAVLCLAVGETVVWAGLYYLFPALLLRWEAAQGWSKTSLTAAFAGAVIVSALFSPIVGRAIDRGRGPLVMTGCALFGAGLIAALPLAVSIWWFTGIWLLIGIAMSGCLYEPCFALITRTRGGEARRGITLVTLIAGFAGTLSFPLNHVLSEAFGWQAATLSFAVLMAICGAPLIGLGGRFLETRWQTRQTGKHSEHGKHRVMTSPAGEQRSTVAVLRHPVFWLLATGFSLSAANHGIVLNHLLPILQDRGIVLDTAVLAASMIGPMQVAGRLAMMAAERRVSSRTITTACFVAIATATISLYMASLNPALIVAFVVLQGSGFGVISIMKPIVTREILGEKDFGTINGVMAVPYLIAFALSPFIGSLLWKIGGYDLALMVVGILTVLGLYSYRTAVRWSATNIRNNIKA